MNWISRIFVAGLVVATVQAADNVMTNGGTSDSWNTAENWSLGLVPDSTNNAVVSSNLYADANNAATPAYSGSLSLGAGSTLRLQNNAADYNVLGGADSPVTLNAGAQIQINRAATITVTQPIVLAGDAQIYLGGSHHQTRNFEGAISGPGTLTFTGNNNLTANLNSNNTFNGLIASPGGNWRIDANASQALGVGDITINNAVTLQINTSNTIDDAASLYLAGGRDTKLSGATYAKLHMGADETVASLYRDGYQAAAGTYTATSGSWISGGGTLTVITSAVDTTPPVLLGSNFVDNLLGGPVYEDITQATYTVTFSEDMDATTVETNDFGNAGSAAITIETVTETTEHPHPSVFTVQVTLVSTGTVQLQVLAGAALNDYAGNALDTTLVIPDDTVIDRLSGPTPPTIMIAEAGGSDNWNTSVNWTRGLPFGPGGAVISNGITAQVNTTPPAYSGSLTVGAGATLYMLSAAGRAALTYPSAITLADGSTIKFADAGGYTVSAPINLLGDVTYRADGGGGSHHDSPTFTGVISGDGSLSFGGVNNDTFTLAAANTFSGGVSSFPVVAQGHRIMGTVDGAFGMGNVTINNQCTLHINATNTIADNADLHLNGSRSTKDDIAKVYLNASESIQWLWFDNVLQATGTWGRVGHPTATYTNAKFTGAGVLTVLGGDDISPPSPDPMTFAAVPHGVDYTSISMTATEAIDATSPIEYQFTNETDSTITGWSTNRTWVDTGLQEGSNYAYRVRARDARTNTTAWSAAASSTPVVDNVMTNDLGGNDSWNEPSNWDLGRVPVGADSVVIDSGVSAQLNSAPPAYSGNLVLRPGAGLVINNVAGTEGALANAPSSSTMHEGASVRALKSLTWGSPLVLQGGVSFSMSHHQGVTFDYSVGGTGGFVGLGGNQNNSYTFSVANSFSGGIVVGNPGIVRLNADGAAGTGDVIVNSGGQVVLTSGGVADGISDDAALFVNGSGQVNIANTEAVKWLFIDDAVQATGTWGRVGHPTATYSSAAFTGVGVLTVLGGEDITPPIPDPMTFAAVPHGVDYTSIGMTASEAIDATSPIEYQFTNETDSAMTGWSTNRSWVDTGLQAGSNYTYRVRARDARTNTTGWSAAASSTPVIDNIMVADGGGNDSWNVTNNWTSGRSPFGSDSAVISNGVAARVLSSPSNYVGNLTLRPLASFAVEHPNGSAAIPASPAVLSLEHGAAVYLRDAGNVTFTGPVQFDGDVLFANGGNPSHHESRDFDGVITGSGTLTFTGINNNTYRLNAANTFAGGFTIRTGNCRVEANADSAFGTADVYIGAGASLSIASSLSSTIDDGAMLFLDGGGGNLASKVVLNSDESIVALWVDGSLQATGTYGRVGHPTALYTNSLFSGNGELSVGGGDVRPPLPDPMTLSTLPYRDPSNDVWMVATEGVDLSGPVEYQFTNAVAGVATAWQTERTWGIPDGETNTQYRVRARDAAGNTGAWSVIYAHVENTMITQQQGPTPRANWNNNGWNTNVNWSLGHTPNSDESPVIGTNIVSDINSTVPPAFSGSVVIRDGAWWRLVDGSAIPQSPAPLVFYDNAQLQPRVGSAMNFGEIVLFGAATVWGGVSSSGHHQQRNFNGVIHGAGGLTLAGVNNNTFNLNAANTFTGGFATRDPQNQRHRVYANVDWALGAGDVLISTNCSLYLATGLTEVMNSDAALTLEGAKDPDATHKLLLNSDVTVLRYILDGVEQEDGTTYGGAGSGAENIDATTFSGTGLLTVTAPSLDALLMIFR